MGLDTGEVFIGGRNRGKAITLLEGAEKLGLEPAVVRTQRDGYVVPQELADYLAENGAAEPPFPGQIPGDNEPWAPVSLAKEAKPKAAKKVEAAPTETQEELEAKAAAAQAEEDAKKPPADLGHGEVENDPNGEKSGEVIEGEKLAEDDPHNAEPAKNASRDDWVAYVRTLPAFDEADLASLDDDDNPGLNRNALVEKYALPVLPE